jgi:signal transduction histidine kinase
MVEQFKPHLLNNVVFHFTEGGNRGELQHYFQIKMSRFVRKDKERIMIQFIDISKAILYDMEKGHNAVLTMINACVSHEMRNPLNSIIAQNIEKQEIYK